MKDYSIINRILTNADKALKEIYKEYRAPFIQWASNNFNIGQTEAKDIFQDVVLTFYKNVINLKLTSLEASTKTYLFAIGKHLLLNRNRELKKHKVFLNENLAHVKLAEWDFNLTELEEQSSREEQLIITLNSLGEKCKKLLKLFYYEKKSHQEIMETLKYNSVEVSRSSKRRCLEQIKNLMSNNQIQIHEN